MQLVTSANPHMARSPTTNDAPPPGSGWFFAKSNVRQGPYTADQLKGLAQLGELTPTDLVWREDMPHPVEANQVRGLFVDEPLSDQ